MKFQAHLADSSFAHCGFSNNPMPPVRSSRLVEWVRDLAVPASVAVFATDHSIPALTRSTDRPIVAWLLEPRDLVPDVYAWVHQNASRFLAILTHEVDMLGMPGVMWVPFGGCWVPDSQWGIRPLEPGVSMFLSGKRQLEGHLVRHTVAMQRGRDLPIHIYGAAVGNPVEPKHEHVRHRFQVVVENAMRRGYFTEKLIDCFAKGVVPIYWGCPDLSRYGFDESGIVRLHAADEFADAYRQAMEMDVESPEMVAVRTHNMEVARRYVLAEDYIATEYPILLG